MSLTRSIDPSLWFDVFWKHYPRKIGKYCARQEWTKAVKVASVEAILQGLALYQFSTERQFQPHAATWLHQHRWEYEPDTAPISTLQRHADPLLAYIREHGIDTVTPLSQQFGTIINVTATDTRQGRLFLASEAGACLFGAD